MFGDRLRKTRMDAGLNQRELGEKAGCSEAMVSQMEKGTKTPGLPLLTAIADALGCSIDYLAKGTGELNFGKRGGF